MLKSYFVNQGLKEVQIEEFIRKRFPDGDYSRMELQRTPLGIKVLIWSSSPGRIIGRGGRTINEMTEALRDRFQLENPQVDVKSVPNPSLDARIVARHIAMSLERGFNFKRVGNNMIKRVMGAGAIGVEIVISGRVSGGKAMKGKFIEGYLKHSGEQAKTMVDYGFEEVYQIGKSKPGKVGIKVKIMREFQLITGEKKRSLKEVKAALMPDAREKAAEEEKAKQEAAAAEENAEKKTKKPAKAETKKEPKEEPKEEAPAKPPAKPAAQAENLKAKEPTIQ